MGHADADAFGRTTGITDSAGRLQGEGIDPTHISGGWGVLTAAAAVVTTFAVLTLLRHRSAALALLVLGSSAAMALSALGTVLYLNAKAPDFKMLAESSRTGGGLLGLLSGDSPSSHEIASAHVEFAAILGLVTALGAAMAAATAIGPRRAAGRTATPAPQSAPPPKAVATAQPAPQLAAPTPTHDTVPADRQANTRSRPVTAPLRTPSRHATVGGTDQLPFHLLPEAGEPGLLLAGSAAER